jgi:hypothetical protein
MEWVVTAFGGVVVLMALRDIFRTLWHPGGRGGLSRQLMAAVRRSRRGSRGHGRLGALAGPMAMAVVVLACVLLIVLD